MYVCSYERWKKKKTKKTAVCEAPYIFFFFSVSTNHSDWHFPLRLTQYQSSLCHSSAVFIAPANQSTPHKAPRRAKRIRFLHKWIRSEQTSLRLRYRRRASSGGSSDAVRGWDRAFLMGRAKSEECQVDAAAVAAYFPLDKVLRGVSALVGRVFGVSLAEVGAVTRAPCAVRRTLCTVHCPDRTFPRLESVWFQPSCTLKRLLLGSPVPRYLCTYPLTAAIVAANDAAVLVTSIPTTAMIILVSSLIFLKRGIYDI